MRVYTRMIETSTPYRAQVWGSRADRQADRGRKRIALFGAFTGRSGGRPERRPSNFGRKRLGTLFGAAFDHMPVDQGPTDDSGPTSRRRAAMALIALGCLVLFAEPGSAWAAAEQLPAERPPLACLSACYATDPPIL